MKTLRYLMTITFISVVLTAHGQILNAQPTTDFHSTSVMAGSGSAYSSKPMLNEDGTASYNAPSYSPVQAPGMRKSPPGKTGGDKENPDLEGPIGDVVLPLMLCALLYVGWQIRSKRKKKAYHFS